MARAYEAPGWGIEHHGGTVIICQRVQVWVQYDRAPLLRPHRQCIGGTGAPIEDQGHSRLVDAQEHDRIEELLQAVLQCSHILHWFRSAPIFWVLSFSFLFVFQLRSFVCWSSWVLLVYSTAFDHFVIHRDIIIQTLQSFVAFIICMIIICCKPLILHTH